MFGHDNQDEENNDTSGEQHAPIEQVAPTQDPQTVTPQVDSPAHDEDASYIATPAPAVAAHPTAAVTDDLLDIKQEALQALSPLVGQLDQTPEEQFRTTMMMIQASDNHALVKVAYEAAKKITNEKERAQALLDIVNEINYFTQHAQA